MFQSFKGQSMTWLRKCALTGTTGLMLVLGLLAPSPARALTYVPLVDAPARAMTSGPVDIDVYYSVKDRVTGKVQWVKHTMPNQRDIAPANDLIKKLQKEGHQVTIGWRRSAVARPGK
jgi:hypothetical protein